MIRRLIAVSIASLLLLALVPTVAFAAATGTARLTGGAEVFPSANQVFKISVTNAEPAVVGKSVNYVKVILPVDEAGVTLNDSAVSAPPGWTATKDGAGTSLQAVTYRTSGPGIPTAGSLEFSFPASVARPASSDMFGDFGITLSSDGGRSARAAAPTAGGTLTTAVRILQLSGLAPTAPERVKDRTATALQNITYSHAITNHALNAVTVTSTLTSELDPLGTLVSATVPGDPASSTQVDHAVTTADVSGDRKVRYTAAAGNATATAKPIVDDLTVQVGPVVNFSQFKPTRVRSGEGANYTFEAVSSKSGTPSLNVAGGSLSFATTTATLAETPFDYTTGAQSRAIKFNEVQVSGADGSYPAQITLTGVDGNDKPFSQTKSVIDILIDNLAPIITLNVEIPDGQTAVKNGDTIKVTGNISQAGDDLNGKSLDVTLVSDAGDKITVPVTQTAKSDGTTDFSGSATANFTKPDANGVGGAKTFWAKGEVRDTAGNIGGGVSATELIDNILPSLLNPGYVESLTTVRLTFADDQTSAVKGGCDPASYSIDGVIGRVEKVTFQGETDQCSFKSTDGSGTRILVLRTALDRDDTPRVTYSELNRDPAIDGAVNQAARQTIETITQIVPLAPFVTKVTRNSGKETAFDETDANGVKTYFTRFAGTGNYDTEDLQVTFNNARNNYLIQVLDGSGKVIAERPLSDPTIVSASKEFTASVRIPLGTTDASYARSIRFVGNQLIGAETPFNVVLDRVVPAIATTAKNANEVTIGLSEPLAAGTDFANDWFAWESVPTGRRYYGAENVTLTDSATRTATFGFQNKGAFGGVDYRFTSPDGRRYEDRAGNLMADTM